MQSTALLPFFDQARHCNYTFSSDTFNFRNLSDVNRFFSFNSRSDFLHGGCQIRIHVYLKLHQSIDEICCVVFNVLFIFNCIKKLTNITIIVITLLTKVFIARDGSSFHWLSHTYRISILKLFNTALFTLIYLAGGVRISFISGPGNSTNTCLNMSTHTTQT